MENFTNSGLAECYISDDTSGAVGTSGTTTQTTKNIYLSAGTAAIRTSPSTSGSLVSRCVKGGYYPATEIVSPVGSSQKWFKHADTGIIQL
ncbi:MAG: hypothetical protein NC247_14535 [Ruminococcus flavefaciens]|nr:hypothetical protein [Ruminococcus flavefaciens]MCM1486741.1 hypothetical protein [Bacillota bacterium]